MFSVTLRKHFTFKSIQDRWQIHVTKIANERERFRCVLRKRSPNFRHKHKMSPTNHLKQIIGIESRDRINRDARQSERERQKVSDYIKRKALHRHIMRRRRRSDAGTVYIPPEDKVKRFLIKRGWRCKWKIRRRIEEHLIYY